MDAPGYQLVMRLAGSRVLAPDAPSRRALARALLSVGRDRGLLAFGAADTHLHALTTANREGAGELAQAIAVSLHAALETSVPFQLTDITPVEDQHHLLSTFKYVQRNASHHGLADPAATEASSLHDLLGMRFLAPWLNERVRQAFPRLRRAELLQVLQLPTLGVEGEPVPTLLADAAAASIGRGALNGHEPIVVAARAAAITLVGGAWKATETARALGITVRSVHRLALRPGDPTIVRAIRRHLAWRATLVGVPNPLTDAARP